MPTYPIRGRMVHVIDESTNTFAGHPLRVISFYSMTAVGVVEGVGAGLSRVTRLCESPDPLRYRHAHYIVGEMCRALDSHGFACLKTCQGTFASLTPLYPEDDPIRIHLGTHPSCLSPSSAGARGA